MKAAEQDLFFQALPDPAYHVDSHGIVVARNRAAALRHGSWLSVGVALGEAFKAAARELPWTADYAPEAPREVAFETVTPTGEALYARAFGTRCRYYVVLRDALPPPHCDGGATDQFEFRAVEGDRLRRNDGEDRWVLDSAAQALARAGDLLLKQS